MSDCITTVEKVVKVEHHPNADRLDIATVRGWQCIVGRDEYREGDLCVYIPIDSVIPEDLENMIFKNAKVKLKRHRVKTIKIRGQFSQGLVVSINTIAQYVGKVIEVTEGTDLTESIGITKYEPPTPEYQMKSSNHKKSTKMNVNPYFDKFQSIQNIKNYSLAIEPDDYVVVTEKLHGTSFRAGWVPSYADTWWKKLKKKFGWFPKYEFIVGSRNVQLQDKKDSYYGKNIYKDIADKYNLKEVLCEGLVVYGEIVGPGIQKGYDYGLEEHELCLYDIKTYNGREPDMDFREVFSGMHTESHYLTSSEFISEIQAIDDHSECIGAPFMDICPILYEGTYKDMPDLFGKSTFDPHTKVNEGVVIWPDNSKMRKLKFLNPDYLLKDNTDYH